MLKKFLIAAAVVAMAAPAANSQLKVFNHLGVDLGIGTTGIGIEVSSPITDFVQMRAGLSIMPGFSFNTSLDGQIETNPVTDGAPSYMQDFTMDVKASLARTQGQILFNVYPFGARNNFFVTAGAYFGGKALIKIKGHSPQIAQMQEQGVLRSGYVEVGDYKLELENGGNLQGGLCAKNFRPYLGLGYGRPCPKSRLGFMVELGVQFMGKMKVCQGSKLNPIDISNLDNDDDWQKYMDKITVYPVLKFTLTGRIF